MQRTASPRRRIRPALIGILSVLAMGIAEGAPLSDVAPAIAQAGTNSYPFPGNKSKYKGFDRYDFVIDGQKAFVVLPATPLEGKPWIWRATFPEYKDEPFIALLGKGYTVAHITGFQYGCPTNVAHWNAFYKYMTEQHQFSKRPTLEGVSRGGLIVYNWAFQNPDKVSCIVCLVPVCDIKSWPGGRGKGRGSIDDWKACLKAYGFTEAEALACSNPIDILAPIAQAKIPILHVCGDADSTVPYEENTKIMEERYRKLGGDMQVIMLKGEHTASPNLQDQERIVAFVLQHTHPTENAKKQP